MTIHTRLVCCPTSSSRSLSDWIKAYWKAHKIGPDSPPRKHISDFSKWTRVMRTRSYPPLRSTKMDKLPARHSNWRSSWAWTATSCRTLRTIQWRTCWSMWPELDVHFTSWEWYVRSSRQRFFTVKNWFRSSSIGSDLWKKSTIRALWMPSRHHSQGREIRAKQARSSLK